MTNLNYYSVPEIKAITAELLADMDDKQFNEVLKRMELSTERVKALKGAPKNNLTNALEALSVLVMDEIELRQPKKATGKKPPVKKSTDLENVEPTKQAVKKEETKKTESKQAENVEKPVQAKNKTSWTMKQAAELMNVGDELEVLGLYPVDAKKFEFQATLFKVVDVDDNIVICKAPSKESFNFEIVEYRGRTYLYQDGSVYPYARKTK